MKLTHLALAMLTTALPLSQAQAAALDRSGQSVSTLFQKGNYAELGYSWLSPDVQGTDTSGNAVPQMAKDYSFVTGTLKFEPQPGTSLAFLFDQPFGADAEYTGTNNFVAAPGNPFGTAGHTQVDVKSENYSLLVNQAINPMLSVHAGLSYQTVEGDVQLRGPAYSVFNGYNLNMDSAGGMGWVLGAAFEKPEIALRAALTYRSEVRSDHDTVETYQVGTNAAVTSAVALAQFNAQSPVQANTLQQAIAILQAAPASAANTATIAQFQTLQALNNPALNGTRSSTSRIKTPQSVNLDFQTGIMAGTLAFANVRWVEWSNFAIVPLMYSNTARTPIASYDKDQWSAQVGLGRKFSDLLSGSISALWDSGAGNPVTTLGPTEGYTGVALGLRITPTPAMDISLGARYLWLGDATAQLPNKTVVGTFKDNTAVAAGVKLGYRF